MADTLRIVTFSAGGRPIEVSDLNTGAGVATGYFRDRSAEFTFIPAVPTVQWSKRSRRYGGGIAAGETHDNGAIGWTAYVRGATLAAGEAAAESLVQAINSAARKRHVEWAPEGGLSTYFEIAGPGTWQPAYNPVEFVQTNAMRVALTFPVLPLARWARPSVFDDFDLDSRADFLFDSGVSGDLTVSASELTATTSPTSEKRARHTARGYDFLEGQVTNVAKIGTTLSGQKVGVILRATSASNYVEVYLDDTGAASRLRIDVVVGGVRTNRASVTSSLRIAGGTFEGVRGRIEGNIVYAERFPLGSATLPAPLVGALDIASYTLVAGDAPLNTTAGESGFSWIAINSTARLEMFDFRPFTYRNLTWPRIVQPSDPIPGTAPALADVTVTSSGGSVAPAFAMVGWTNRALTPIAGFAPFAVNPAAGTGTGVTDSTNWTSTADAGALSGTALRDAAVSGAETYTAAWLVDPSALVADDFTDAELALEVWARMAISSSVVSTYAVLSARSADGTSFGAERYSSEWGSAGRLLALAGGTFYKIYRLGTLLVPADPAVRRTVKIWLTVTTAAGSTGSIALDYIIVLPARSRALSPTAKRQDASYPAFIASTSQTSKTVRSDLSALTASPPNAGMRDHGLGGSLIEPPAGLVDWLLKLSSVVPDDPVPTAAAEQLTNAATFQIDVTPRSYMLRSA